MKTFETLGKAQAPDGGRITLHAHDGEYYIKHNGRQLMSTIATESELLLGDYGCRRIPKKAGARVLIGGLGLGFTLRRVLELCGEDAEVDVAELLPEVVAWNRDLLGHVNGRLLEDPRVTVLVEDVFKVIREARGDRAYDAILLDTVHTPSSWVQASNVRLYARNGFSLVGKALKPGGVVAYWSAGHEPEFVQKLAGAGFKVTTYEAKTYPGAKRAAHRIYVGAPVVLEPGEEGGEAVGPKAAGGAGKGRPGFREKGRGKESGRYGKGPKKGLGPGSKTARRGPGRL